MRKTIARLCAMTLALLCFFSTTFAQSRTITGTVKDPTGVGLSGVTVAVKGTNNATQTDSSGAFTINASPFQTLVITTVGYGTQEVPASTTHMNINMQTSAANLNEVVVVGYGTARRRDVTGSVASVKAKDFNQGVIAAPDQLLQGKVPGLEITNNSGQPGAATTIKIRGNNSIRSNNNPLYVVDGVPLDGRTARPSLNLGANGLDFGPTPESNPLLYLNPNDIAQIDVLKDAASTAIYGSRGANGIIVITTKKAAGSGTKLEFGTSLGVFAGFMKKYKVLTASEFRSASKSYNINNDSSASVDPLKEATQSTITQNYNLALSGGSENGRFRASFLGSSIPGFLKKTSLDKYLGNFGGSYKFLDKRLSIDFSLIAGHTTENIALISNTAGAGGNLMAYILNWNPTAPFKNSDGSFKLQSNSVPNPLSVIEGYDDVANVNVFLGNISATVNLTKGLDYKFLYAVNHGTGERNTNIGGWLGGIQGVSGLGFGAISHAALTSQTFTHTLSYNTDLTQDLTLNAVAGYEYWKTDYSNSTLAASQFNWNLDQNNRIPILYTSILQNAKTQYPVTTFVDPTTEIQSFFGRVNLSLRDKYVLTAIMRADGSNKFGKNNRYGYFPSVGGKWIVSHEDFLKGSNTLSYLALRASWGITGNQEFPSGASLEQFSSTGYNSIGQSNVANPDLKWEKTTSYNVGLDYSLFGNKVSGTLDYYNKSTTDLLFQSTAIQPAPASIFFINLPADLRNKGIEFSIGATLLSRQKLTIDANWNIAYNKNLLTKFNQAPIPTGQVSGQGVSGTLAQIFANGYPVNEYFLKEFKGYDTAGQQIIGNEPVYIGDPNPHVISGFTGTIRYEKLSFTFNFNGAFGYKIYNNTYNTITNISQLQKGQNIAAQALNTDEAINSAVIASSRYLESGDYVKLRNATFNYAFGDVGRAVKGLNAFVSATNLFVITKFNGFDPEVNVDKSNNNYPSRSMEYIPYPTPRIISFGLNFSL